MKRSNFIRNMGVAGPAYTLSPALGSMLRQPDGVAKPPTSNRLTPPVAMFLNVTGHVHSGHVTE